MHVRSQSVPVIPDIVGQRETTKLTPKFGTWGIGVKGVSEDWDNDFDFDLAGTDPMQDPHVPLSMHVPLAIQAAQATVVGHVGQIREVCLLVEDLKRLRGLARERGLLDGPSAGLWKEADGIIALAVPDEEDLTLALSPPLSPATPCSPLSTRSSLFDEQLEGANDRVIAQSSPDDAHKSIAEDLYPRPPSHIHQGAHARRRSVFSTPEDNIFGFGENAPMAVTPLCNGLEPPLSLTPRQASASSVVARSVMEHMHQHRSTSDPMLPELVTRSSNKMPFDTTSLRDLVNRASTLSRTLADIVRKSEGFTSPNNTPRREREASPAFTRVFTEPTAMVKTPPSQHLPRSHSANTVLSLDASPARSIGNRMHMMAVS